MGVFSKLNMLLTMCMLETLCSVARLTERAFLWGAGMVFFVEFNAILQCCIL